MCRSRPYARCVRWQCACGRDLWLVLEEGEAVLLDRYAPLRDLEPITHCVVCQRPVPEPRDPALLALLHAAPRVCG